MDGGRGARRPRVREPDLFEAATAERLSQRAPLATRMRPRALDEMVGQRHLFAAGAPLRVLIEQDRLTSAILWGPPGTGKTTLASVVAHRSAKAFVQLSAVSAGVADVRGVMEDARRRLGEHGQGTILFIDEVHRFNRAQQDTLLPAVEQGLIVLIGATTENPFFSVNSPLLSRATLWRLEPLSDDDVRELLRRALTLEGATAGEKALEALVSVAEGDARVAIGTLEVAFALAGERELEAGDVERARAGRLLHQGTDAHFDQISALIKSVRGSDTDAGLYWLARMLDGGEDPRFIARRLVILASEDVGMADPLALVVADAAARAVEFVGLPEAQLNLAQAVVYLACAPKSNRVTVALGRAQQDVRNGPPARVPVHLRDPHYPGAAELGNGDTYRYPHDDPRGWVEQEYRPAGVADHVYYEPSPHGSESALSERAPRRHAPQPDPDAQREV
jgi:putative ATPase